VFVAAQFAMRARCFRRLALGLEQRGVQHILHQRGFAGARHAGDAHQMAQRNRDVYVLQIVLGGAAQFQLAHAGAGCLAAHATVGAQRACQILARLGSGIAK
jgi:hypothetical protein